MTLQDALTLIENETLTVEECAKELGLKPQSIRNMLYLNSGLRRTKLKSLTLITKRDLEDFRQLKH